MQYEQYLDAFMAHGRVSQVRRYAHISEGGRSYPLLEASTPGDRTLLITAGFHGNETAGPLTLLTHFREIERYASARGVGLLVYPCLNPSGFEDNTRYNRSGENPNNDFLRYEVAPGEWVGELTDGQTFLRHRVFTEGPKETRALVTELERQPTPAAALDIHQDPYLERRLGYAYSFGDNAPYRPLLAATAGLLPLATRMAVDDDVIADEDGLVKFHDGSITDYFHRRGVPWAVALETTTVTPMEICHQVNLVWIKGFVDLVADGRER
jgi:predicted deacylase